MLTDDCEREKTDKQEKVITNVGRMTEREIECFKGYVTPKNLNSSIVISSTYYITQIR